LCIEGNKNLFTLEDKKFILKNYIKQKKKKNKKNPKKANGAVLMGEKIRKEKITMSVAKAQ
jgi:hypothetical protein